MAIDIRATVVCSLGTLISGSLSDDYLQGSGLIKTRGTVEISGLITPAIGTVVTFTYTKNAVQRSIPRTMRVMSSFADPYRRTTKVELGCKLTYFSDLEEPLNWDALDDPENSTLTTADQEIVTVPIYAKSLAAECCTQIGLDPTPVSVLTNKFSIAEFDFSSGYVNILSDLLVSESYCGYLNASEALVLIDLSADGGTGPALTEAELIDLGPIGTGQLPGEAVIVEYSSLKLKNPDGSVDTRDGTLLWEDDLTSNEAEYVIPYTIAGTTTQQTLIARGIETIETLREFTTINDKNVLLRETVTENKLRAGVMGSACSQWLANGVSFDGTEIMPTIKTTTKTYDDDGNEIGSEEVVLVSQGAVAGKIAADFYYPDNSFINPGSVDPVWVERRTVREVVLAGAPSRVTRYGGNRPTGTFDTTFAQDTTTEYVLWHETIEGQQAAAVGAQNFTTAQNAVDYINAVLEKGPILHQVRVDGGRQLLAPQERPSTADLLNAATADDSGDPNNGWRTESEAEVVLALGSAEAQRRITFRMPYAPDDTFSGPTGGPFTATASDAEQKAITYGRVQNRLLLGNRNGMNIQVATEKLPAAPFAPLYIQANGLTALYRVNGNQWAFSSDGIAASTDALFWAAVGGTGTFDISANPGVIWFPVSPTVTVLPAAPAVDGNGDITTTAGEVIPPFNETVPITLSIRTVLEVTALDYPLATEETVTLVTYTVLELGSGLVDVPVADFSLAALPPLMSTIVSVPTASFALDALIPDDVGFVATALVQVPTADFALAALAPSVSTASVFPPTVEFALAAPAPAIPRPAPSVEWTITSSGAGTASFVLSDVFRWFFEPPEENDISLVFIEGAGNDATLTPPSGWAAVTGSPVTDLATSAGSKLQVWWHRLSGSDLTGPVDLTIPDGGDHQVAFAMLVRGCVATGDPWDVVATATDVVASTSHSWPAVTTTRDNTLIINVVGMPNDYFTGNFDPPVNAGLSSLYNAFVGHITSAGNDGMVMHSAGVLASAGSSGNTTATSIISLTKAYMTIALKSF